MYDVEERKGKKKRETAAAACQPSFCEFSVHTNALSTRFEPLSNFASFPSCR